MSLSIPRGDRKSRSLLTEEPNDDNASAGILGCHKRIPRQQVLWFDAPHKKLRTDHFVFQLVSEKARDDAIEPFQRCGRLPRE
jgi:hypothetical protein